MTTTIATTDPNSQHMKALASANRTRFYRADLKRKLVSGRITVAQILDPGRRLPVELERMTIAELLRSQDRWGRERTRRFCIKVNIGEARMLGTVTRRQRLQIIDLLSGKPLSDPLLAGL